MRGLECMNFKSSYCSIPGLHAGASLRLAPSVPRRPHGRAA